MSTNSPITPPLPNQLPAVPTATAARPVAPPPMPWMNEEKKDAFDIWSFLHSLRRTWLVGLGLGLLVASILAAILWFVVPVKYEAQVILQVRRDKDRLYNPKGFGRASHPMDYEIKKKTQVELIKSNFVITAALSRPGIAQLPMVRFDSWGSEREEPEGWVASKIRVNSPEGQEIVFVTFKDEDKEDVKELLQAVTDAYMEQVVYKDRTKLTTDLRTLQEKERELKNNIQKKHTEVNELSKALGSIATDMGKVQLDMQMNLLDNMKRDITHLENEVAELSSVYNMKQTELVQSKQFKPEDFEVEDALTQAVPEYFNLRQQLLEMKSRMRGASGALGMGGAQGQIAQIQGQMEQIKNEKKKEIIQRLKMVNGGDARRLNNELQLFGLQYREAATRLQAKRAEYEQLADSIKQRGEVTGDLEVKSAELVAMREELNGLSQEIGALELEVGRDNDVELLQPAVIPNEGSWLMKVVQVAGAWVFALTGTMVLAALWDFLGKRLNSTKDMIANSDVRVIGSLPNLSGRRTKMTEKALTRSIDSVRTALLYSNATHQEIEVVLVTSALGQEGKTTVASQLAVSLARSGKKTLLIDGDIQNPQQHIVLGISGEQGLCELLRGEVALEDAVQTSPAENLWVLPAGLRDINTDQMLSSPMMETLFEEFTSRFEAVVVDSGPVLTCPDAMLLGQHADAAVVAVRRDVSRLPKVVDACERLRSVGITLAGCVVNGVESDVRQSEIPAAPIAKNNGPRLEQAV